jgi:hypothetical protein
MTVTPRLAQQLNEEAIAVIMRSGLSRVQAESLLFDLRVTNLDFCCVCHYKRKRKTGDPLPEGRGELEDLMRIIELPQRDGDSGDLDIRWSHARTILWALYWAPEGFTDWALHEVTEIYLDSCKGMRANLMKHGWIVATGRKLPSSQNRPMEVWVLSSEARRDMEEYLGGI